MSPPLRPCCSNCFSNKNKCSSRSSALAPSALAARPLNLPRYLRDPQPQGQRAGGVPMSLAWHPAGCSRAGPPRGSGQPASHEPGRAPEQTPFVWGRVVGASGTQAPEPALPPPPRRDPGPGKGPCRGGREAARHNRTERGPWGYISPRAAQESGLAVGWRGEQSLTPPVHHGVPDPAQEDPPARCQPGSAPRRDPRPGLGEPVGPAGQERAGAGGEGEAAAGEAAVLSSGPGPGGCSEGQHEAPSPTVGAMSAQCSARTASRRTLRTRSPLPALPPSNLPLHNLFFQLG